MSKIDPSLISQLQTIYQDLQSSITLCYYNSNHPKQQELIDMLSDVASTSDKINTESLKEVSEYPRFKLQKNEQDIGITFSGIPGGHEFSSLILAILNSDLKGKLPDEMIQNRIKALKGPIHLRTVVSLSCENCPDVVQALNLMAALKEDFSHEMVDGEFIQEELNELKVQGVPAVLNGSQMIHSGQTNLSELLQKLENTFGKSEHQEVPKDLGLYDVVVIGGGPAGVSSAIYSVRKGLKTAIITDRIGGQMQDTKGIENFISLPYTEGPELSASLFKHMSEYDIQVLEHRRVEKVTDGDVKSLQLNSGESLSSKALIVATGAKWRELGIEGEKEYLGRGVAFCPHCDGPYYKGKDISVIGGGNSGVEAAIDLAGIVKSVTVVEFANELKADQVLVNKLQSLKNAKVIKGARTDKIIGDGEKVTSLDYEERSTGQIRSLTLDGVFVQIGLIPNSSFIKDIVATNKFGEIEVNDKCRTNVSGIYAAGDVTTVPYKQIIISMGEGAKAGLSTFEDLMLT